jgi:hypothetical protein
MTKRQSETLDTIRANGGYACRNSARAFGRPVWSCAILGESAYYWNLPALNTRVADTLCEMGLLRRAPGHGYGSNSFWEIDEERALAATGGGG